MKLYYSLHSVLLTLFCFLTSLSEVQGAITFTGGINPNDPTSWTASTNSYVGYSADGSLTVDSGSSLNSNYTNIGFSNGLTGAVTIDGNGSTWSLNGLGLGGYGTGVLNLLNGGNVTVSQTLETTRYPGSQGTINFGPGGGTITANTLMISPDQLTGMGTINTKGLISDLDLVFDSMHDLTQTIAINNITINLAQAGNANLGAGYRGIGSMCIREGKTVSSQWGEIGVKSNSSGTITVEGTGSTWNLSGGIYVGHLGNGTLNVVDGGTLKSIGTDYLGLGPGSSGTINVDGNGSTWVHSFELDIGGYGLGTLNITNGGTVSGGLTTATCLIGVNSGSVGIVKIDGNGSKWSECPTLLMRIGHSGNGSLFVTGGATVDAMGYTIGYQTGSEGLVKVDGNGSTLTTRQLGGISVGVAGRGTLIISGGGKVASNSSDMIDNGIAKVDGMGSNWTTYALFVGNTGNGTLEILNGGSVSCARGFVGKTAGSRGAVKVIGNNSTWNISSDFSVGEYGNGALNIEAGGQVNDSTGYISYQSGTGAALVTGAGSKWTNSGDFYVGRIGGGSLNIEAGGQVSNAFGYLGYTSNALVTVTVKGTGSKWLNSKDLYIGYGNNSLSKLCIDDGGMVSNAVGIVGLSSKSTVIGPGSLWDNSTLSVSGSLNIIGGGEAKGGSLIVSSYAVLSIDVGTGSKLTFNNGSVSNNGKVRIVAGAGTSTGYVYSPIAALTWSGIGSYNAIGGTWNATSHQFTVSGVQAGASGALSTLNLAYTQRLLTTEAVSQWKIGESFLAKTGSSTTLNFTATAISGTKLNSLKTLLPAGYVVEGAWDFSASGSGYTAGDPVYLSFDVGPYFSRSDLTIWHYSGTAWSTYTADDLTYDGQYASFTVTSFSGYAVSAIPEPGTLVLLIGGLIAMAAAWKRMKKLKNKGAAGSRGSRTGAARPKEA
jgi:fibronectin-binding autotransporter adhesin